MTKYNRWKMGCAILILCAVTIAASAQTFSTLVNFDGINGESPYSSLIQGSDGNLYGTTFYGGSNSSGTVYKIALGGTLTTIDSFCTQNSCIDGENPYAGLVLATDGNSYGTTEYGGVYGGGTLFRITSAGTRATLSFTSTCGFNPMGTLVQGTDGSLYGTTSEFYGTVFKITQGGVFTTLHTFAYTDGANPYAGVVLATDGNFYGTTNGGGNSSCNGGCGTVFRITPSGTLTTLYSFNSTGGFNPDGALVQAADGNLYGTTRFGGANRSCYLGASMGCGTIFKLTLTGNLTMLYSFCAQTNCTDGANPFAGLIQATDGNFYGTTLSGGNPACDGGAGCGTVFEITPKGLKTLHNFDATDGDSPYDALLQATDGNFYGTTGYGGSNADGTIFSLNTGLGPFVAFVRPFGKIGQTGGILGQGFTGTTAVAINGVPANFKVVYDTYLTATVPPGATTGYVTVTTPTGVLTSNVPFHVIQ